MNNDINLDFGGIPLNMDKLKENFNTLKESFPEIYFNYGCDHCTKEVRDKREGYCKDCTIWQESPEIKTSLESRYTWGFIHIYADNGNSFYFRNTNKIIDITNMIHGEDYLTQIDVFKLTKSDVSITEITSKKSKSGIHIETDIDFPKIVSLYKLYFLTNEVLFIPKSSIKGKIICDSLEEVVNHYDVYRNLPTTISYHPLHGEKYTAKNIYIKLELIK